MNFLVGVGKHRSRMRDRGKSLGDYKQIELSKYHATVTLITTVFQITRQHYILLMDEAHQ